MQVLTINRNRITSSIAIGLLLVSVFASALNIGLYREVKAADPTISVTPTTTNVTVGQQFSINLTLDYAEKLYGFEAWLSFNSTLLNATSLEYMNYLNEPTMEWHKEINNTGGYVSYARSSQFPATGKTGGSPPPLIRINFTCVGIGTSQLHFTKTILSDDQARPITHTSADGQVNCAEYTAYNDVIFDSNFNMGNLINVQFQTGNSTGYRYYTAQLNYSTTTFPDKHWWFYFSMSNTTGKTIKIQLINLAEPDFTGLPSPGIPRWQDIEPVYTYDDTNWLRVPDGNYASGTNDTRDFNITVSPTQSKIWLAPVPPYTVTMRDNLLNSFSSSPYLTVGSLGTTPLGLDLKVATITDPGYPDQYKFKIYVISQQHSGETVGSFVTEGMIRFLVNDTDPKADALRKNYIFRFVPIVNVEGVYYGISRYSPFRSGAQQDLNRAWNDIPISTITNPEVNWTFTDIQNWMPDAFLDMHSEINGESGSQTSIDCFFLHDGLYDAAMINFCNNVSRGFTGTKDYWPETGARSATGGEMAATNVRTRLGIHPAVDMEHPHDDLRNTTEHPVDHNPQTITDWIDWGRKIDLGLFDYYGEMSPPDLVVDSITVDDLGCAIYANDTDATNATYYYPVEVVIRNLGSSNASAFHVKLEVYWINGSLSEGSTEILVSGLDGGSITTVNFTSMLHPQHTGYYRLTATTDSQNEVSESNETNNLGQLTDILVTIIGDVNKDKVVNILDGTIIGLAWNSTPADSWWNIKADVNHDGKVDLLDASRLSSQWRKYWT